ncbi:MAG: hypothetical protein V2A61_03190 [Calditrichota bacterium]
MKDSNINTPRRSRCALIWGIISLILVIIPLIGAAWTIVSMPLLFFVIPILAVISGALAIWKYILNQRNAKGSGDPVPRELPLPKRSTTPMLGLIFGLVGVAVGVFYAAAFTYFAQASMTEPRPLPGETRLFYYGQPEYDEMSLNTVLEPDTTLLTLGWRRYHDAPDSGYNAILIQTTLQGQELKRQVLQDAAWGRIAHVKNGVIGFLKPNGSTPPDSESVLIMRKEVNSDNLTFHRYIIGKITGFSYALPAAEGGAAALGYLLPAASTKRTLFLFTVNSAGDSLGLKLYPDRDFGVLADFIALDGGGFAGVGYSLSCDEFQTGTLQLWKMDDKGDLRWDIGNEDSIRVEGVSVAEDNDGKLVVLGMTAPREDGGNLEWLSFSKEGQLLNRHPIGSEYVFATQLLKIDDSRWMTLGYVSRSRSLWQWGKIDQTSFWDTWHISVLDREGELEQVFDGGRDRISAWRGLKIAPDVWAITGFGSPVEVKGRERADEDVALLIIKIPF